MENNIHIDNYHYVETSAQFWPNEQKLRDKLSVPMTLQMCPLQFNQNILQASFSSSPKVNSYRCHSCKGFVNNLCKFKPDNQDYVTAYDCSLCGCTNNLPKKIHRQSAQIQSSSYLCKSINPSHCMSNNKKQTLVFVIDISSYGSKSKMIQQFNNYAINVIKNMLKLHKINAQQNNIEKNYQIMILAFSKSLHEYYISEGQVCKRVNTHLQQIKIGKDQQHFIENIQHIQIILDDILKMYIEDLPNMHESQAFLPALEVALAKTANMAGRIYVISGIAKAPIQFNRGIFDQPQNWKQNFQVNKKKCIPQTILTLCEKTQMSVHFYIYNRVYINLTPLYVISKITNGALRHYDYQHSQMFYHQFQYAVCIEPLSMGLQAVLRVRHSSGLKIAGIFGQYRNYKSSNDQIEMVSCPSTRKYIFQFVVEGKIHHSSVVIQFSILYTNNKGERIFKIVTQSNKLSNKQLQIIQSINYKIVNSSYVNAILHNMDAMVRVRNLQIALQDRCKDHFKQLRKYTNKSNNDNMIENSEIINQGDQLQLVKKARSYSIFTYLLLRHYLMNTKHSETLNFQKYVEMKSRMLTTDDLSIHTIWPAIYSISQQDVRIIQMKQTQIKQAQTSLIIDQGDFCHIYIKDEKVREKIIAQLNQTGNTKQSIERVLKQQKGAYYESTLKVLENIRNQKLTNYMQILFLSSVDGLAMLDQSGPLGYSNFINTIIQ